MTITLDKTNLDELRERAIALSLEAHKAEWAGDRTSPVHRMAFDALDEVQRTVGYDSQIHNEIYIRFATYLLNLTQPGYVPTIAWDGDLDHPMNSRGEIVDLTGAAA